jgi:anaerobic magnesium-protoporphyrin IX monomethyl ester cyclase
MRVQFLLKNTGMWERLGIMTLSSVLKKNGHEVELTLTEELSEKEIIENVKKYKPSVLAYSIMTGEHVYHMDLNAMIRGHYDALSVFGGPHPTYSPEMINKDYVDAVCRGEGEIYFLELVEKLSKNEDFYETKNFWFKTKEGKIIKNPMGELVSELDETPLPDRSLMYGRDEGLKSRGTKLFMATRGCPYQCTYCFNHAYNALTKGKGEMIRSRSVDSMIKEIKEVQDNYFMDRVNIDDDIFLLKPKGWLEEFAEKYPKVIGLPLFVNVRPETVTEHTGALLKKMNCTHVAMGIECGHNETARKVLKRNTTNERIVESVKILKKNKVKVMTQNLIGLPIPNPVEVDYATLDFNIKLGPYFAWSSILYPYPGTEIGTLAKRIGYFDDNYEKTSISNKTGTNLKYNKMEKRKIDNFHKLFSIIVEFPFLRPFTNFLISLPFQYIYTWIYFAFYGYKYLRQSSFKGILYSFINYVKFYFKYVSRLEKKVKFNLKPEKSSTSNIINTKSQVSS